MPSSGPADVGPGPGVKDPSPNAPLVPLGEARPAARASIPEAVQVHASQLFPHIRDNTDPQTGGPLPIQERSGGQFSARQLVFVNAYAPDKTATKVIGMGVALADIPVPQGWRWSNPSKYPGDVHQGNTEIVFDFEDQRDTFLAAHGVKPGYDPLRLNDISATQFPPGVNLAGSGGIQG